MTAVGYVPGATVRRTAAVPAVDTATAGYATTYGRPTVIPAVASAAGMAVALGIGAIAGVYPAAKAARLAPAEALRSS